MHQGLHLEKTYFAIQIIHKVLLLHLYGQGASFLLSSVALLPLTFHAHIVIQEYFLELKIALQV